MKKSILIITSLVLVSIFFNSCTLIDLHRDLQLEKQQIKIIANIKLNSNITVPVVVALIDEKNYTVINHRIITKSQTVSFTTEKSSYKLYAFEDLDKNYEFTLNEKIAISKTIDTMNGTNEYYVELSVDSTANEHNMNKIQTMQNNITFDIVSSSAYSGTVVTLDSEFFSDENVYKGLWQSFEFAKSIPFGIFLLEEYDPKKKIVLFIHGISGSPRVFKDIINNLDKSKYQAMVAYYPSGISLYDASEYLARTITELRIKFEFKSIDIVAHSMGGLVARNLLNILCKDECFVDTFITISSPFAGDKLVVNGVRRFPVVIPVWRDMSANSQFIKSLYRTPIADKVNYYMLFGVKGKFNNDGVVAIPSQLRIEAQEEAKIIRGYNESHMSILKNKDVSNFINSVLE